MKTIAKTYSITEVSKMYHLPTTTLRYYEDLGLLYDIPRVKGRRVYTQEHLNRLGAICCFKDTGMTLKELQELFQAQADDSGLDKTCEILDIHYQRVLDQLTLLKKNERHIKRKVRFYHDIRTAKENHSKMPDWNDYRDREF
ncbi:MerR family transcriptional regulator [Lentilactobacillus parabuchneri]|uniref:HTH-type transcriptional regulator AdhR n=2 Tax=Lentilactobacillus parabuchneri TaxID=152331 RepID=A0A1X1FFY6_9LACO|nr:MerR family transcriptional regulator [Lentilactobacillus parabuchneri]APR07043.1 HTH-type transcriptional regulator AdhR [Lentilactobacillus parabuchneri]KRM46108.1 MerR family transcriptional regulator [Lentilactobacillus parabuchneri DSM 5707 = NBRC 107865]KRN79622.1 MerR family transcriptional regulator [Lentilactobacillus parabuchneri]MBW0223204.1 MerR family transcriptional regulator [Lentilactobacillus parabuchneri]MBW0263415.1 MerR family transcriptional regulator [Lentilactobacillu